MRTQEEINHLFYKIYPLITSVYRFNCLPKRETFRKLNKNDYPSYVDFLKIGDEDLYATSKKIFVNGREITKMFSIAESDLEILEDVTLLLKMMAKGEGCESAEESLILEYLVPYLDPDILVGTQYGKKSSFNYSIEATLHVKIAADLMFKYLDQLYFKQIAEDCFVH